MLFVFFDDLAKQVRRLRPFSLPRLFFSLRIILSGHLGLGIACRMGGRRQGERHHKRENNEGHDFHGIISWKTNLPFHTAYYGGRARRYA